MMLAERDLVLDGDLSAELKQTTRELREDDDRLQDSLAKLDPRKNAEEIDRLRGRQRELREKRSQLIDRVRAASPRLAALQYPQALDLTQVQQALDPGTVLLSYQIGSDTSRLFVVRRSTAANQENLTVHAIAIGEAGLARTGDRVSSPHRARCWCQGRRWSTVHRRRAAPLRSVGCPGRERHRCRRSSADRA